MRSHINKGEISCFCTEIRPTWTLILKTNPESLSVYCKSNYFKLIYDFGNVWLTYFQFYVWNWKCCIISPMVKYKESYSKKSSLKWGNY